MKHTLKITFVLLGMFLLTQFIGLAVIHSYTPVIEQVEINGTIENVTINPLPYGMQPPELEPNYSLISIIFAFVIAITIFFFLTKIKMKFLLHLIKVWFFVVVVLVVGITINAILMKFTGYSNLISLAIALPLAIYKVYKRNIIVHNFTELMIYPGIAAVFVPLMSVWTIIIFLIIISIYDMWAVWHSGIMQKMAKFQINHLKIFSGFFVPYLTKKQREKIKKAREKIKKSKTKKVGQKFKSMKINTAILGGGDIVFPIITAGVILRVFGLIPSLIVIGCATIALAVLFYYSEKGKFYPAMPFITAGLFIGMLVGWLIA